MKNYIESLVSTLCLTVGLEKSAAKFDHVTTNAAAKPNGTSVPPTYWPKLPPTYWPKTNS